MAQRRRRKNKKWLGTFLFLVLLVIAGVICYLVWDNYFRDKGEDVDEEKSKTVAVQVVDGDEEIENEKVEVVEKEKTEQYDGEDPNIKSELTGVITYAGVMGSELVIRVNIDQYLAEGGCYLVLSKDGAVIYDAIVEIVDSAATATCAGFNVPVAGLGEGSLDIVIDMRSGDKEGTISGRVEL